MPTTNPAVPYQNQADFAVVRLNADGSQDTTFADNGIRTTHLGPKWTAAAAAVHRSMQCRRA